MSDFTREIRALPSYDYRDDRADQRGCCGVRLFFILQGPEGVITWELLTGLMHRPIAESDQSWSIFSGRAPRRATRPGADKGKDHWTAGPVHSHVPSKTQEHLRGPEKCDFLGECFGDSGYLVGDGVLEALTLGGSDGAFEHLEGIYRAWVLGEETEAAS